MILAEVLDEIRVCRACELIALGGVCCQHGEVSADIHELENRALDRAELAVGFCEPAIGVLSFVLRHQHGAGGVEQKQATKRSCTGAAAKSLEKLDLRENVGVAPERLGVDSAG